MRHHVLKTGLLGLFVFLSAAVAVASRGITVDGPSQLSYARSLYGDGAYGEAAVEFSRFIHFFPDDPDLAAAHYSRALSYYMGASYERAGVAFARFQREFQGSPLCLAAGVMEAQCLNRGGNPQGGMILLSNLKREFQGDGDAQRLLLARMAWTRLDMGDLPQAEAAFKEAVSTVPDACGYTEILHTLDRFKALPEKSPGVAGGLALIPGGGYLYLGRYQDATVAFLLNVALGFAAVESFEDNNNALGALISFVGFGFYSGSIHGSYTGALKENRQVREGLWKEMLLWESDLEERQSRPCLGLTLSIPY